MGELKPGYAHMHIHITSFAIARVSRADAVARLPLSGWGSVRRQDRRRHPEVPRQAGRPRLPLARGVGAVGRSDRAGRRRRDIARGKQSCARPESRSGRARRAPAKRAGGEVATSGCSAVAVRAMTPLDSGNPWSRGRWPVKTCLDADVNRWSRCCRIAHTTRPELGVTRGNYVQSLTARSGSLQGKAALPTGCCT